MRQALSMRVLVAARFNPDLGAKYFRPVGAGKPGKLALTAHPQTGVVLASTLLKANCGALAPLQSRSGAIAFAPQWISAEVPILSRA